MTWVSRYPNPSPPSELPNVVGYRLHYAAGAIADKMQEALARLQSCESGFEVLLPGRQIPK